MVEDWALEESGLDLVARVLVIEAKFRVENSDPAVVELQMERLVEYRDIGKVVRELPRKELLEVHPDWWYCQGNYCFRIRTVEDRVSLGPHTPMQRCLKMRRESRCSM